MAKNRITAINKVGHVYTFHREDGTCRTYESGTESHWRFNQAAVTGRNSDKYVEHQSLHFYGRTTRRWFPMWRKGEIYQIELTTYRGDKDTSHHARVLVICDTIRRYGLHHRQVTASSRKRLECLDHTALGYDHYDGGHHEKHVWYLT